jgi:hypothetical protein
VAGSHTFQAGIRAVSGADLSPTRWTQFSAETDNI